jgi:hypothetical protein
LRSGKRPGCPLLTLLFNTVLGILARIIEKRNKGIQVGKEVKLLLLAKNTIMCRKTPKHCQNKNN